MSFSQRISPGIAKQMDITHLELWIPRDMGIGSLCGHTHTKEVLFHIFSRLLGTHLPYIYEIRQQPFPVIK